MGSKTKLIPMEFKDQNIRFQILDSNWLDKMKQVKELAAKQPLQQTQALNQKTVDWANRIGVSMHHIIEALNNIEDNVLKPSSNWIPSTDNLSSPVIWLQEKLLSNQNCPHLADIKKMVWQVQGSILLDLYLIQNHQPKKNLKT